MRHACIVQYFNSESSHRFRLSRYKDIPDIKTIWISWSWRRLTWLLQYATSLLPSPQIPLTISNLKSFKTSHKAKFPPLQSILLLISVFPKMIVLHKDLIFQLRVVNAKFPLLPFAMNKTHMIPGEIPGKRAGGERGDRGWDGRMTSPTQWTWIWASSGR